MDLIKGVEIISLTYLFKPLISEKVTIITRHVHLLAYEITQAGHIKLLHSTPQLYYAHVTAMRSIN